MFGLSFIEIIVVVVVAILVFGDRLPTVAAEAATFVTRMKRSLADLRRETGIDREFAEARRAIENSVPRSVRNFDLPRTVREEVKQLGSEATTPIQTELHGALEAAEAMGADAPAIPEQVTPPTESRPGSPPTTPAEPG
jgi:Sec-independent protein translocase protein TatA